MTETCRQPCCTAPRLTVTELLERGLRRNRAAPLAFEGVSCSNTEGHLARFSLEVANGKVAAVGFRASSCATLIAYCELIAETVPGLSRELAGGLSPRDLVDALPGVPLLKRERAVLAVAAFHAALSSLLDEQGESNEGRIHLRYPAP